MLELHSFRYGGSRLYTDENRCLYFLDAWFYAWFFQLSIGSCNGKMLKVGERRTKHRFCTTLRLLLVQEVTVSLLFCFQSALGPSPFHMFNNVFSDRSTNIPCCKPKYFISGHFFLKKKRLISWVLVWIYLGIKQCQRLPSQLPQQS